MSKHKGPKRKRLQRKQRLHNAKEVWLKQTNAKNIVKSYAKWYGIDLICAITELEMLGHPISENYKLLVKQEIEAKTKLRTERKQLLNSIDDDVSDENFAFIAGFTDGGLQFGITHEEWDEMESNVDLKVQGKGVVTIAVPKGISGAGQHIYQIKDLLI